METICRTVILAKAPVPGQVKTRLIPALGAVGAAELAAAMLERTVAIARAAELGPVELCVAPSRELSVWGRLQLPPDLHWSEQGEGHLGERMGRVARRTLEAGESVLLIGMDCPSLGVRELRQAAFQLQQGDVALLPTHDGGYALLGLSRYHSALFSAMAWSTATVYGETLRRIAEIGWSYRAQPALGDIDVPDDLMQLKGDLKALANLWSERSAKQQQIS